MARDKSDNATRDLLNPNPHGGFRTGAGRKPSETKKTKLGWYVTDDAKKNIELMAADKDYTPSELLDYLMKTAEQAPLKLES